MDGQEPDRDRERDRQTEGSLRHVRKPPTSQLQSIMSNIRDHLSGLSSSDNEKIMSQILALVDYYQFHVSKLKSLVQDKQNEIAAIQSGSIPPLQQTISGLREEIESMRHHERDIMAKLDDAKFMLLEKEKEISRYRVMIEEEKSKVFHKRLVEQDWIEEVEKCKREAAALRELNCIKDDEINYLKKNLRSLEEESIDLRDQKRELTMKLERLSSQPINDERSMIEKSSKYLVDQINSLKRELFKAKNVVENYKNDRESERQEENKRYERRRNSLGADFNYDSGDSAQRENKVNSSFDMDQRQGHRRNSSFGNTQERKSHRIEDPFEERPSNPSEAGFRRRGHGIERRHEMVLESNPSSTTLPANLNMKPSVNLSEQASPNDPFSRRDPNRGHGNIIAAEYPEEFSRGRNKGIVGGRIDSAKKQRLQTEIGKFYCAELESDPVGYLTRLQQREAQLKGIVAKLPQRAKKGSEIAEKLKYETELEEHSRAIHKIKHSLK